jgi:hypothetical protein
MKKLTFFTQKTQLRGLGIRLEAGRKQTYQRFIIVTAKIKTATRNIFSRVGIVETHSFIELGDPFRLLGMVSLAVSEC